MLFTPCDMRYSAIELFHTKLNVAFMIWKALQLGLFMVLFSLSAGANDEIFQIDLFINNHVFEPSAIEAPAGQKIKLVVHNNDDTIEEFESSDLKREKIIPAKGMISVIIAPLPEGAYEFFGDFHQDTARGVLNVK
ncbi:MAG: cupredoxin domain-containing protein [Pseudomonadota bacterium]